jgi:hypothetical protein
VVEGKEGSRGKVSVGKRKRSEEKRKKCWVRRRERKGEWRRERGRGLAGLTV